MGNSWPLQTILFACCCVSADPRVYFYIREFLYDTLRECTKDFITSRCQSAITVFTNTHNYRIYAKLNSIQFSLDIAKTNVTWRLASLFRLSIAATVYTHLYIYISKTRRKRPRHTTTSWTAHRQKVNLKKKQKKNEGKNTLVKSSNTQQTWTSTSKSKPMRESAYKIAWTRCR